MNYRALLLLMTINGMFLFLAGCGGIPVDQSIDQSGGGGVAPPPPVVTPEQPPAQPMPPPSGASDDAVDQLLAESMQLRAQGDLDGAISMAERALRIAPRNTRVYYVLGTLYLDKGEAGEALQLARKASSLDTENFYRRSIDRLIADCEAALAAG